MASTNLFSKASVTLEMLKFEHTIFALPFAYVGMILGARSVGEFIPTFGQFFWITLAMVGARSFSMALNRLMDREIDARNPRTMDRALPKGLLSVAFVEVCVAGSLAVAIFSAWMLTPLTLYLAPLIVALFVFYSYAKRVTWACHFVLGACLGMAPIGAWAGVTNTVSIGVILLGAAVGFWTAGFDTIYACQDLEFDRREGLFSIPARFGTRTALIVTRILHLASVVFLIAAGLALGLGSIYFIGTGSVAFLLFYENCLVKPNDLSKLNAAFFAMNGVISINVLVFTVVDIMVSA